MDREYLTIWLKGGKLRKCVGLAKESTISSGARAREMASWKVLVSATCFLGTLFAGSVCFAQSLTLEHSKVDSSTKSGKPVAAQSQSVTKSVSKTEPDSKALPAVKTATEKSSLPASKASADGKPVASVKASVDTKVVPSTKPVPEAKAQPAVKPAGVGKPAFDTKAVVDTKPAACSKTSVDSKLVPAAKTVLDAKAQPGAKPAAEGKKKDDGKAVVADKTSKDKHSVPTHGRGRPASLLVPPPPPDTPTMIPEFGGDDSNGLMPMEYMSPDLLKKRKQDLVAQLADAKSEAKKRVDEAQSIKDKGAQFKTLFEEGVISKRELDAAEKEANDVDSSINRAQLRVSELQTLLDGVSGRINQISKKHTKTVSVKVVSTKERKKH
jgi:hypothetical protein